MSAKKNLHQVAWVLLLLFPAQIFSQTLSTFQLVPIKKQADVTDKPQASGSSSGSANTSSNVAGAAKTASAAVGGGVVGRTSAVRAVSRSGRFSSRNLTRALKMAGFAAGTGKTPATPRASSSMDPEATARRKMDLTRTEAQRLKTFVKTSPMAAELRMPFAPSNILFAVGATAGMTVFSQMGAEGEGLDLGKAVSFLGDKNFWGGLIGSGVGYSLASIVAMSLIPGGAGLIPMVMPMFAGMAGSILGWELGSGIFQEGGWKSALENLDPARVLGQAAGTTAGLMVGANLATMIGGTLGSVAGPIGAIAGALLLGNVGAKVGESLKSLFSGDSSETEAALQQVGGAFRDTENLLGKLEKAGSILADVLPASLPSANLATEGLPAKLVTEYRTSYRELQQALIEGNRPLAHQKLKYLSHLQSRYQGAVGETLQELTRESPR